MKRCSASLIISEIQSKITSKCQSSSVKKVIKNNNRNETKKQKITSVGKHLEKLEFLCTAMYAQLVSHVQLFTTPWTATCQTPLSMEFSRQEYWSGLSFPPPGDLPHQGIKPISLTGRQIFTTVPPKKLILKSDLGIQENKICHCIHPPPPLFAMKWWDQVPWC